MRLLGAGVLLGILVVTVGELILDPPALNALAESTVQTVQVHYVNCTKGSSIDLHVYLLEGKPNYLSFPSELRNVSCDSNGTQLALTGINIGFAVLRISDDFGSYVHLAVGVIRPPQQLKDKVFLYGIMVVQVLNTLGFGISLDLQKVRSYLRKPVGPALGFVGQFVIMPLIAFTLTRITSLHPAQEFGIFATGVVPGGGASTVWCFLLEADVDLSVTISFITSIAAIGMIPLWMYTLGPVVTTDQAITIPFKDMIVSLAFLIVPLAIGLLINRFLPKVAKVMLIVLKVFCVISIVFAIVMGIYANLYAFWMTFNEYQLALCSIFLPYIGGLLGFTLAKICRLEQPLALTVSIETALANTQLSTILLRLSFKEPWGDISSAIPACLNMFTPWPLLIMWISRCVYLRVIRKSSGSIPISELPAQCDEKSPADDTSNTPVDKPEKTQQL